MNLITYCFHSRAKIENGPTFATSDNTSKLNGIQINGAYDIDDHERGHTFKHPASQSQGSSHDCTIAYDTANGIRSPRDTFMDTQDDVTISEALHDGAQKHETQTMMSQRVAGPRQQNGLVGHDHRESTESPETLIALSSWENPNASARRVERRESGSSKDVKMEDADYPE